MSKIYELPLSYRIARSFVKKALYLYYDEIIISGKENVPENGPFIFAPNHRNALMDALAIHLIAPKSISTSFLARADIFKNKYAAKFMRFAKIMPAFRFRDGFENLSKNNDVFDSCVELLEAKQALCIMPEGNQELAYKIRPLVKGIFRVAFSVQQRNPDDKSLKIIPVGLNFANITKFGKHLVINIGEPVSVTDFYTEFLENQPRALNQIKETLKQRMESLSLHIDSEENYETILEAIDFCAYDVTISQHLKPTTLNIYNTRKQLADKLSAVDKQNPEAVEKLSEICFNYKQELLKSKIQNRNTDKPLSATKLIINTLLLILGSPLFLAGFASNLLPFFGPVWIRKAMKVEFEGFFSSIQFVLGIILFPMLYTIQSVLICQAFNISFIYFPLIITGFLFSGIFSFNYFNLFKKTLAFFRYNRLSDKKKNELKKLKQQILKLVTNPYI